MNNEKNRQLTPDEAKRNEAYEKDKARLEQEGYKVYDLTSSVVKSNVMAVVLVIPFAVIFTLLYFIVHKPPFWEFISDTIDYGSLWGLLLYFAVIFVLMIVHELIHGVTRALFLWSYHFLFSSHLCIVKLTSGQLLLSSRNGCIRSKLAIFPKCQQ